MAGQRLSVRDIELLAHAYFRGTPSLREAIEAGKLGWSLDQLKGVPQDREGCNAFEQGLLGDLQTLQKSMRRVLAKCRNPRLEGRAFYAQANLLSGALLTTLEPFCEGMKEFYDRTGNGVLSAAVKNFDGGVGGAQGGRWWRRATAAAKALEATLPSGRAQLGAGEGGEAAAKALEHTLRSGRGRPKLVRG